MVTTTVSRELSVALDRIVPNPWNTNQMDSSLFNKELSSLKKWGQVAPITVRTRGSDYEIIDGEHRWKAARQLGWKEILVWDVGDMSDADAKQLSLVLNRLHGVDDPLRLRDLLRDLTTSEPLPDLLEVLPWSKSEFSKLADLPTVDWKELETSPSSAPPSRWVERIYRLPLEAAKVLDEAIERAKGDDGVSDGIALERIAADYLSG